MDNKNSTILTDKQEMQLRKPIDDYIGKIQSKIDNLRAEGTQAAYMTVSRTLQKK